MSASSMLISDQYKKEKTNQTKQEIQDSLLLKIRKMYKMKT